MRVPRAVAAAVAVGVLASAGCSDEARDPGYARNESDGAASYEYTIPPGAGEALDAGTPLEILPAELDVTVGETIRIVNDDDRGHNVGPFFVGAGETVSQEFTSPGEFVGQCTVHPSGELVLDVAEA